MVKNYNSSKQLEKKREGENERITEFNNNKAGEMLEKGMAARKDVLKEAGIMQEYNFEDHQHIYNYADDCEGAPIETIGDNIVRCSDCGNLKDGNLLEEEQCRCGLTKRGMDSSPSPSRSPSPEPSRKVLRESFSVVAKNEKATNFFLTPGARNLKSDNPAITPRISRALEVLADLTEYHHLGGAPA